MWNPPKGKQKVASIEVDDKLPGKSPNQTEEDPVVPALSVEADSVFVVPSGHCAVIQV